MWKFDFRKWRQFWLRVRHFWLWFSAEFEWESRKERNSKYSAKPNILNSASKSHQILHLPKLPRILKNFQKLKHAPNHKILIRQKIIYYPQSARNIWLILTRLIFAAYSVFFFAPETAEKPTTELTLARISNFGKLSWIKISKNTNLEKHNLQNMFLHRRKGVCLLLKRIER